MFADREFEFVLWGNEPHFMKGYAKEPDATQEGVIRRKAYTLLLLFFVSYVYKVQYDNEVEYQNHRNLALIVLGELL